MTPSPFKRNRLSEASSPYLQQHADNPVHWQIWSEETLSHAKAVDKPILLSIGYAACHWCHVMAHESFEDNTTGQLMNDLFVNIKVDREERPDIDQIYMAALHAMGEQGGWPLTMFLTPDGLPYWGGTYFPPAPAHGRPGFQQVLHSLSNAYHEQSDSLFKNTQALKKYLSEIHTLPSQQFVPDANLFLDFRNRTLKIHDPVNGGIKGAPKFPNAPIMETWARGIKPGETNQCQSAFIKTLEGLCNGGIYDHIGGGLSRYSVDDRWLAPHFEKMLYDNAHFLRHLSFAYRLTGKSLFRNRIEETISWLQREMTHKEGAFYSSIDADSEGEEGKFYVWTADEIDTILGHEAKSFAEIYDVTPDGNWEGKTILNRLRTSDFYNVNESKLNLQRIKLFKARQARQRPGTDDKILTDWNGYMIRALCEASIALEQPEYLDQAKRAFHYISESNLDSGDMVHSSRDGIHSGPANASDYAAMMNAAISLCYATGQASYFERADRWARTLLDGYTDGSGGFYLNSAKTKDLPFRPTTNLDEANPSAASQILEAFIHLNTGASTIVSKETVLNLISSQQAVAKDSPYGMAAFMNALDEWFNLKEIAIIGTPELAKPLLDTAIKTPIWAGSIKIAESLNDLTLATDLPQSAPDASKRAYAVVCQNQTCSAPLHTSEELEAYLKQ